MMKTTLQIALCALFAMTWGLGSAAAQNPSTDENRSYQFYMTPDELRTCIVADYEREQLLSLIETRRRDLELAQAELLREQATREDYQRVRQHYNSVLQNLNDMVFQENTLVDVINNDCRKPFYKIDYEAVSEELGFGWTTRWQ